MKKVLLTFSFILGLLSQSFIAHANEEPITLWGTCVSPFTRKVVSVLEEKKLDYELTPLLPTVLLKATEQPIPAKFKEISPLGKIPAIQVGSFAISDSSVIIGYLENKWPEHPVYPSNKEELAKALWYEKYADTVLTDVFHKIFFETFVKPNVLKLAKDEQLVHQYLEQVPAILAYLESELVKNKRRYLVNDHLTIADIAITHHFISLQLSNIQLSLDQYPHLLHYLQQTTTHPSIQATMKKI